MEQSAQRRMVHVVRILILVALNLCIIGLAFAPTLLIQLSRLVRGK